MLKLSKSLKGLGLQVTLACLVTVLMGCPGLTLPVINSVTPNVVPATTVDTVVTFRGRNFQNGATATFTSADGTTVSATVATTFTDSTTVRCTAPKSTLVTANLPVSVTIANPDGNVSEAVSVTYTPPPDVATVTPTEAPATIGTALTLAGQNFSGPAEVRFRRPDTSIIGTQSATIVSSNSIQVTSPVDNTLTADTLVTVEVINNDDQISAKVVKAAGSMTYLAPPTATAITPGGSAIDTIPASTGASVTITGTNFETGMTVSFDLPVSGATPATNVVVVNATTLTCDAPAEPTLTADATANVTVTAPDGQSSAALASYYAAPPIVSGMTPGELPVSVEFPFTITGTGFKTGATVSFALPTAGATPAVAPVNVTATAITGNSPIEPAGVASPTVITVTVTNLDGQADSTTCTYWPPPVVDAAATPNPTPTVNLASTLGANIMVSGDLFRSGTIVTFRDSVLTRIEDAATAVSGTGATAGGAVLTCQTPVISDPAPPNPRGPRLLADELGSLLIVGPQGQTASISLPVTYVAPPILNQAPISATFAPANVPATLSIDWSIVNGANFDTTSVDVVFTRLDTNAVFGTVTVAPPTDAQNVSGTAAGSTGTPLLSGITVPTNVLVQVRNQDQQISEPGLTIVYDPPPIITSVINDATGESEVGATGTAASRSVTINGANFGPGVVTLEFDLPVAGWTPVAGTVVNSSTVTCVAPALASGTIPADTAVAVRITNPDNQVTNPNGSINYQAEPSITTIQTFDSTGTAIPGNVIPSSIANTTTFTITDAQGNFVTIPGNAPAVTFTSTSVTEPFVSTATGVVVNSETSLEGVPQNVTITVDAIADVLVTDEYLQPSNTITVEFTAPPVVTLFEAQLPKPGFQPDVFGSTNPVAMRLTGDNFQANAEVEFFDAPGGTSLGTPVTIPTLSVDDTELTGANTPSVSITTTLTNAAIVVTNVDGQSSAAYGGIKIVAPPTLKAVTLLNGDPAVFTPNGALRNDWNSANGTAVTFNLIGTNLDSQTPAQTSPVTPATGWAEITLSGGALAIDGVVGPGAYPGGDDLARILNNTTVQFELRDNADSMLASLLGHVDILSLTDWTGQTTSTGITDAMLTILGPTAATEMNAVGLATGDFSADGVDDLVVVQSDVTTVRVTVYPALATGGYEIRPAQTIVSSVAPIGNGLTTPGCTNVLVEDLDQDGNDDLLVGIPGRDFIRTAAGSNAAGDGGALYIWYGTGGALAATPTVTINATLTVGATGTPGNRGEGFGAALATGDHNGDGYTDLVVSAPGTITASGSEGVAYFYQGSATKLGNNHPPSGQAREINGSIPTPGTDQPDGFGLGLALGDWEGDGDDELFVGAPGFNDSTGGLDAGKVVVYFGDSNMDTTVDWELAGGSAGNTAAYPTLTDIDGDMIDDLLLGLPRFGVNYAPGASGGSIPVFLGQPVGTIPLHKFTADTAFGWSCANDNVGMSSNVVPLPGMSALFIGAPHVVSGNLPGRAGLFVYDAGTATFSQALGYNKPVGAGLAVAGEGFATSIAYCSGTGGMDVFASIPGGIGGANDGFVAYYPGTAITHGSGAGTQTIPDAGQLADTIDVPLSTIITDANLRLEVRHASLADLAVTLESPAGTTVALAATLTGVNLAGTAFDDEAAATIDTGAAPFSGSWQIDSSAGGDLLADFDGEDALGTWTLTIQDLTATNTGTLEAWSLTFNTPENP